MLANHVMNGDESFYVKVVPDAAAAGGYTATHITRTKENIVASELDYHLSTKSANGYRKAVKVILNAAGNYEINNNNANGQQLAGAEPASSDLAQIAAAAADGDDDKYVGAKGFWSDNTTGNLDRTDHETIFNTAGGSKRKSKKVKKQANHRYNKRKTRNYPKNNEQFNQ